MQNRLQVLVELDKKVPLWLLDKALTDEEMLLEAERSDENGKSLKNRLPNTVIPVLRALVKGIVFLKVKIMLIQIWLGEITFQLTSKLRYGMTLTARH